jgi:hypothetical protein
LADQEYEIRRPVEVEINGKRYIGGYRMMAGSPEFDSSTAKDANFESYAA